jgi:4-amino-4-deoxy-L-arabinose transferase-like glycosyltransferase
VAIYIEEGPSLLHPKLPVFGPPWEVPFECPIYQLSAAAVGTVLKINADLACRVTSLIYFYASALLLALVVRELFADFAVTASTFATYVFSPFGVLWSRTALIEFAAVTFALAFIYFAVLWVRQPRKWWLAMPFILAGSLGALTKITTMAITIPPVIALLIQSYIELRRSSREAGSTTSGARHGPRTLAAVVLAALLCVFVGWCWVRYADSVKAASPATSWLTVQRLSSWNHGFLQDRFSASFWTTVLGRITLFVLPFTGPGIMLTALAMAYRLQARARTILLSLFAGAVLPMLLFTSLYSVHDYYLSAVFPLLCVVFGYGISAIASVTSRVAAGLLVIAIILCTLPQYSYCATAYAASADHPLVKAGEAIRQVTQPDDWIVVADMEWDPSVLYYARRRGYMLCGYDAQGRLLGDNELAAASVLSDEHFRYLLSAKPHPELLARWRRHETVAELGNLRLIRISEPLPVDPTTQISP